ncbi:MAG TPA: histidine kinase N-terminal 7TM domain-containing protein, partial [Desulfuromonadaceae bacterium]
TAMPFYATPYVILPLLSACVNAGLAVFSLRRRQVPAAWPLFWLMLGMSGWSLAYALNTAATSLPVKVFFLKAGITFVCIVVPSMLALALETIGLGAWLTGRRLLLVSVIPLVSALVVWTGGMRPLHVYGFSLHIDGSLLLLGYREGPLFLLHSAYANAMGLAAMALFASGFRRMPRSEWFRFALLILATVIPIATFLVSKAPGNGFNYTTSTLFFSGIFYTLAVFRYRLLDLMPLARTALFDQVGEPVLVFNDRGDLVDCNHVARQLAGGGRKTDIARVEGEVLSRFPALGVRPGHGLDCLPEEYVQDAVESDRYWRLTASDLAAGAIRGTLIVLHDVSDLVGTGRKLVDSEQHLRELNATLRERVEEESGRRVAQERLLANQARLAAMGEMIGAIAHQWRQPLATLGMVVQRTHAVGTMQGLTGEQLDEFRAAAMRQIRYMSDTIEEFRGFYRPEKEKKRFCPFDCIADCLRLFDPQFTNSGIVVEVRCPHRTAVSPDLAGTGRSGTQVDVPRHDCAGGYVYGLPNEFKQVVLNLLGNARDAILASRSAGGGPEEGHIDVTISVGENGGMIIDVSDNGCGIPADIAPRIFDPYFTTKEENGGTGIGLYMSRMIVEDSLGGCLSLVQGVGGTLFRIELNPEETL